MWGCHCQQDSSFSCHRGDYLSRVHLLPVVCWSCGAVVSLWMCSWSRPNTEPAACSPRIRLMTIIHAFQSLSGLCNTTVGSCGRRLQSSTSSFKKFNGRKESPSGLKLVVYSLREEKKVWKRFIFILCSFPGRERSGIKTMKKRPQNKDTFINLKSAVNVFRQC